MASRIRSKYGFAPDPSVSSFRNAVRAVESSKTLEAPITMPSNMAFHDLTPNKCVPEATKCLLGLGSKFIPTPKFTTGSIESNLQRLQRDFFIKVYHGLGDESEFDASGVEMSKDHEPKLYVKSKWNPTEARSNLLPFQEQLLDQLLDDSNLLFPETDKGLGPCAVTYDQYVEDCLLHLRNQKVYEQLSDEAATAAVASLEKELEEWCKKYKRCVDSHALAYIEKHIRENSTKPFGQFYVLYKIHKGMKDGRWPTRPVCSDVSSLPHGLGKWVNEMLTPVQQGQPSYFKDSYALKTLLDDMALPPNALLFTSDASSMYTNIKTEPALEEISQYLRDHGKHFHITGKPLIALIDALHLVFNNNLFRFGDTTWRQKSGTAMGTPPAPPWATIFYALHERDLVPRWSQRVSFYKRFLDDVIGVWLTDPDPARDALLWSEFEADMNKWFGLEWVCTKPSNSVNFMDLTITIVNGKIETTLYEKPMNLYLYIPPHSSHPKGVYTGLIFGQVLRIRRLCTHKSDADRKIKDFYNRLLERGHTPESLLPLFSRAEENAYNYMARPIEDLETQQLRKWWDSKRQVYFHLQFHPEDPPSRDLQRLWRDFVSHPAGERPLSELKNQRDEIVGFSRLIVAYSRPLNLRNRFSVRDIHSRGRAVSEYLAE